MSSSSKMALPEETGLPFDAGLLAAWFAEGVKNELAALERDAGTQRHEVLSGRLVESKSTYRAVYQFILADSSRLPEDTTGRLKTSTDEYTAYVVGQQLDRIHLFLESSAPLPAAIPRAVLTIDDTALLRRLVEVLADVSADPSVLSPLGAIAFNPSRAEVGLAELSSTNKLGEELHQVLRQACGSSVTYVWGPPGTGKTYGIAYLIAALTEKGERVLVTSHTNAAVNQILYETVKSEEDRSGPLAKHQMTEEGRILRIGHTMDRRVPPEVSLDSVVESRCKELEVVVSALESSVKTLERSRMECSKNLDEWELLSQYKAELVDCKTGVEHAEKKRERAELAAGVAKVQLRRQVEQLARVQRAWFRRATRVARVERELELSEAKLTEAEKTIRQTLEDMETGQYHAVEINEKLREQQTVCSALPARDKLERSAESLSLNIRKIDAQIQRYQEEMLCMEQKLIDNARVVFCTLTKTYVGRELDGQTFDAVVVDEISMALPPLILLAAGRATSRVVLAGDFLQLPPIVRSDTPISNDRLGNDIFHLAGVVHGDTPVAGCSVLADVSLSSL